MRPILIAAAVASLAAAGVAYAAQPVGPVSEITVSFGKEVGKKPRVIGARERAELDKMLRQSVSSAIGGLSRDGGRLELVIEDAKPNRPTMTEQSNKPGISYTRSFGIGGAKISGVYVSPDGARTPVGYSWYESDIRNARFVSEWHDVDLTFDRFAKRLADGKARLG